MAAILHVLNVSLPSPQALQSIDASFLMMGNHVDVNPISLRGGDIELVGAGSLSTSDYSVNLNLANVNPRRWARIPMLADFVEGASRELVGIQVTGPIGHPTVRTRPLGGLSDEFKRLFQKRQSPLVRQAAP